VPVPSGYGGAAALAADPKRPGVWFLAANANEVVVFFWDARTRVMHTYAIPEPQQHGVRFGMLAGLAVAPGGTVWVGTGRTLVSIDEATGVTAFATPSQPGPANPLAAIESLAVGPSGQLAIAYYQTSYVDVRSASGTYSTLTLPDGLLANAVAYLPDGTLGVAATAPSGLGYNTVVIFETDGAVSSVTAPSWGISAAGDRFLTSMQDVDFVSPPEPGHRARVASAIRQAQLPSADVLRVGARSQIAGPWVLASTKRGFVEVDPATGAIRTLTLPTGSCQGISIPPNPIAHSTTTSGPCRIAESPTNFVVDGAGHIWFTDNFDNTLFEANPTAFRTG
jgi:hypothetical protein